MSSGLRPSYSGGPIRTEAALAGLIGLPFEKIAEIAGDVGRHYREVRIEKDDNTYRVCWDPSTALRQIQRRLVQQMLREVKYPSYLHGSLPKRDSVTRDYVTNAKAHARARWCICLDIKSFFPSVSASLVNDAIWSGFFHCTPPMADLLTRLTTLDGWLPQGSLTASYIANLVLWRQEPRLVALLEKRGLRYTRYVDDITISATGYPLPADKTFAVSQTNAMLRMNGLRQKRGKVVVATAGRGIEVMGLSVVKDVGRSKGHRRALETEVLGYAGVAAALAPAEATKLAASLRGKLAEIGRYHPREAQHLRSVLDAAVAAV